MNEVQNEEVFKNLLEIFIENNDYENIINFLEDNNVDSRLAPDFAEELLKYEDSIEIFLKLI